jgi:hypothetical protein
LAEKGIVRNLGNRASLAGATAVDNAKKVAGEYATGMRSGIRSAPLTTVGGTGAVMYAAGHGDQYNYQKAKAEKAKAKAEAEAGKEG